MGDEEGTLRIESEHEIVTVRTTIRETASELGFGLTDTTRIVTSVSELARNIYLYAGSGSVTWSVVTDGGDESFEVVFADDGPGIEDVDRALQDGYSTSDGMGRGLSGTRELMDEFEIESEADAGTTVTIRKHLP